MALAVHRVRLAARALADAGEPPPFESYSDESFLRGAFHFLLQRNPDDEGLVTYGEHLGLGRMSRSAVLSEIRGLDEYFTKWELQYENPLHSLHRSRCLFVRSLPKARRILDLGGTHQQSREGAFVLLGYPYRFEQLVVVDLPVELRHELYQQIGEVERADTRLGPVEYHYRSMVDLSPFPDESFDLVYSGQSIEHISVPEAEQLCAEVRRVLRPGGSFCLDTPNGRACELQLRGTGATVTNPDHEIEYTHEQLAGLLERSGLRIVEAKGLNHLPESFEAQTFSFTELGRTTGVYDDLEQCYLLAYVCSRAA